MKKLLAGIIIYSWSIWKIHRFVKLGIPIDERVSPGKTYFAFYMLIALPDMKRPIGQWNIISFNRSQAMTEQHGPSNAIEDHEHEFTSTEKPHATGRAAHLVEGGHIIAPDTRTCKTYGHGFSRVNQGG